MIPLSHFLNVGPTCYKSQMPIQYGGLVIFSAHTAMPLPRHSLTAVGAPASHDMRALLAQRIYALCCSWEDVTDHNTLRYDLAQWLRNLCSVLSPAR
jgi:hypothetical protein